MPSVRVSAVPGRDTGDHQLESCRRRVLSAVRVQSAHRVCGAARPLPGPQVHERSHRSAQGCLRNGETILSVFLIEYGYTNCILAELQIK